MADYENADWFRNYLRKLESDIQRLESRVETSCCVDKMMALERYVNDKFESNQRAVEIASRTLSKRLDAMNEFREALRDQANKMMTRDEYSVNHEMFRKDLSELTKAKERMEGKASQTSFYVTAVIAALSLFVGMIHVLRDFATMVK